MSSQPWLSGSVASGLATSSSVASTSVALGLAVPVDAFGFGDGWFHGFVAAGLLVLVLWVVGLVAVGFDALSSVASDLVAVRFKQHQSIPMLLNPPPRPQNSMLPNLMWEKTWAHLVPYLADVTIYRFQELINIITC